MVCIKSPDHFWLPQPLAIKSLLNSHDRMKLTWSLCFFLHHYSFFGHLFIFILKNEDPIEAHGCLIQMILLFVFSRIRFEFVHWIVWINFGSFNVSFLNFLIGGWKFVNVGFFLWNRLRIELGFLKMCFWIFIFLGIFIESDFKFVVVECKICCWDLFFNWFLNLIYCLESLKMANLWGLL